MAVCAWKKDEARADGIFADGDACVSEGMSGVRGLGHGVRGYWGIGVLGYSRGCWGGGGGIGGM